MRPPSLLAQHADLQPQAEGPERLAGVQQRLLLEFSLMSQVLALKRKPLQ